MTDKNSVTLIAYFSKAVTTIDGGWRISFDVSADEAHAVMQLSELRDKIIQCAFIPVEE